MSNEHPKSSSSLPISVVNDKGRYRQFRGRLRGLRF